MVDLLGGGKYLRAYFVLMQHQVANLSHHTMSATLSKKQQKALSFRAKQKAKKEDVQDVPEADLEEEEEEAIAPVPETIKESGRKRKREKAEEVVEEKEEVKESAPKKKKSKEAKQRFILFLGE